MRFLLAAAVVAVPVWLVVQAVRGRVRPTCCSVPADQDARLR